MPTQLTFDDLREYRQFAEELADPIFIKFGMKGNVSSDEILSVFQKLYSKVGNFLDKVGKKPAITVRKSGNCDHDLIFSMCAKILSI